MPIGWRKSALGDCINFQRGFDITRTAQRDGSVPVISSGGISSYHDEPAAYAPGVVIGRKGTLGKVFYTDKDYWPHDTTLWVRDFKGSHPRFVYYFMKNFDTAWLDAGSANPTLNRNHLHPLPVLWPPLAEQRAVAEVLGALDDKIAANRKLAATADALARTNFRYATCRLLDDAGLDSTYDDVAVIGGGGTPKTGVPEYWGGEIPWATPTDITALDIPSIASTSRTITEDGLANSSARLYPTGSILMTSRATIGAFAIAENPVAVNQGFIVVNAKNPENQWWLFHDMRARVEEFIANANGATFLELPRGRFKSLPVAIPDHKAVAEFSAKAAGLHHVAVSASAESRTLGLIRDTLLPRLMSGELRVRDAERVVENAL